MSDAQIRRALISVTDKTGIQEFAAQLAAMDIEILSTGGTATSLRSAGIQVVDVSAVTGFPEIFDGRLKTIHPLVAGGMLMDLDNPKHVAEASQNGILPIGLVVVNLYDFFGVADRPDASMEELIAKIDIGGPTMIRAAAKNWGHVAVVTHPAQYDSVIQDLTENDGKLSPELRFRLMLEAFRLTALYETYIVMAMQRRMPDGSVDPAIIPVEREV